MFTSLHEDLRPYIDGPMLRHPLVNFDFAHPGLYSRLNRYYEFQVLAQSPTYTRNRWDSFHPELPPDERVLQQMTDVPINPGDRTDEIPQRLELMGQCWTAPDVIAHDPPSFWTTAVHFRDIDTSLVMSPTELSTWQTLPKSLPAYRGHGLHFAHGLCWYLDESVASAWASLPGKGYLSRATISQDQIWAFFDRRCEQELIVPNPQALQITTVSHQIVAS